MAASPFPMSSSGGRIRTSDLRVMSPTSYQTALPRDQFRISPRLLLPCRQLFSRRLVTPYVSHTPLSINIYLSQSNALVDILSVVEKIGIIRHMFF